MKILFLNHNLIWRGSFFRCLGFARELVKRGHQVEIWTVSDRVNLFGSVEDIDGVKIWKTPRWGKLGKHDGGYAIIDILTRMVAIFVGKWDVIHAFEHRPNVFIPWVIKRSLSSSTVFLADWSDWWTAGGIITAKRRFAWMDRVEQFIEEKSKSWADGVTVISTPLQERASSVGISTDDIALIPSGIDINSFPCLDRNECRKYHSLSPDKVVMGFVGFSLWDMQMLADTFALVKQQSSKSALLVIGGGVEESQKDIFRSRFTIDDEVLMPGVVPFEHVPQLLGCCDILLLPMQDNLANLARVPNKLMDYFAAGRPVVAPNLGDTAKYINQFNAGIVCDPNAGSMADTCISLINNELQMINTGRNARQAAENHFAYSHISDLWEKFYQMKFKSKKN